MPIWLVAAGIAVLPSCSLDPSATWVGSPVVTAAPTAAPAPVTSALPQECLLPRTQPSGGGDTSGLVQVDPHPLTATLLWLPGLNNTVCRPQLTTLPTPAASQLADDIRAAPAVPPGRYNCPADDATAVTVYFRYAHQPNAETVDLSLSGCAFISAPHRAARRTTPAIRTDLREANPPDWARYLTQR